MRREEREREREREREGVTCLFAERQEPAFVIAVRVPTGIGPRLKKIMGENGGTFVTPEREEYCGICR